MFGSRPAFRNPANPLSPPDRPAAWRCRGQGGGVGRSSPAGSSAWHRQWPPGRHRPLAQLPQRDAESFERGPLSAFADVLTAPSSGLMPEGVLLLLRGELDAFREGHYGPIINKYC